MYFLIRDDDTNFFTSVDELQQAYGCLWQKTPISLSIVPYQKEKFGGSAVDHVLHNDDDNVEYHIGDNNILVNALSEMIRDHFLGISLHGYNHVKINGKPEFYLISDPKSKISQAKSYLETLFKISIDTFVPPWNTLSKNSLNAIDELGMNLLGFYSLRPFQRKIDVYSFSNYFVSKFIEIRNRTSSGSVRYFKNHKELICHGLTPRTNIENLMLSLKNIRKAKGTFCLATHYWELNRNPSMKHSLAEIVNLAKNWDDCEFITIQKLWK